MPIAVSPAKKEENEVKTRPRRLSFSPLCRGKRQHVGPKMRSISTDKRNVKRQERNPRQRQRQIKRGYETNFFGALTNSFSAGRHWHFGSGLEGFSEGAFKVEGEGDG